MGYEDCLIAVLEAIYVVYMLNWFQTTVNFSGPSQLYKHGWLFHPVRTMDKAINPVCAAGNVAGFVFAAFVVARLLFPDRLRAWTPAVLLIGFFGCFLNFNVLVYMLPVIALELASYTRPPKTD